jgi:hypothetical protein
VRQTTEVDHRYGFDETTEFTRADLLRPGFGEDALGPGDLRGASGVDRNQEIAALDLAFAPRGFAFRDAQADESTGDPAGRRTDGRDTESGHDRTDSDQGTDARNGQCTNSGNAAQRSADDAARAGAGDCCFGRLRVPLMREHAG